MSVQPIINSAAAESKVAATFDNVMVAAGVLRDLARLVVSEGATRTRFPRQNADAAIQQAIGDYRSARYDFERALIEQLMGEKQIFTPTPSALALALQHRVQRNEERGAAFVASLGAVA